MALLAVVALAAPVLAQGGMRLSVRRVDHGGEFLSRLRYEVAAGGSVEERIIVQNFGSERSDYVVYATDLFTDGHGNPDGPLIDAEPRAMGRWLSVSPRHLSLGPKQKEIVTLRMEVPAGTPAGDHAGFLFVQKVPPGLDPSTLEPREGRSGAALAISTRLGIPITQRVPGDLRREVSFLEPRKVFEEEDLRVEYGVENPGNLLEYPDGRWVLTGPEGQVVLREETENWGILEPGGRLTRFVVLPADRPLVRGEYRLKVHVDYGPPEDRRTLQQEWPLNLP